MTGALWRSAIVAALFAWHPLHVESVAWIAERKDLLSAFFWLLTLDAYLRYVEKPDRRRNLFTLLFFCWPVVQPLSPLSPRLPLLIYLPAITAHH